MLRDALKRLKATYVVNNILNYNKLKATRELYVKYGLKKSVLGPVSSKNFKDLEQQAPWLDVKNSSEALGTIPEFGTFSAAEQEELLKWSDQGYAVLSQFYQEEDVATINSIIDEMIAKKTANWRYGNSKIMFAINQSDQLRKIVNTEHLNTILSTLLGKKVKLFQSINFINGSQQAAHSDSIHMTTHPLGYLIAVWIALEDMSEDNGPLFYYPGSHKLPYVLNDDYNHGGNYFLLGEAAYPKYESAIADVIASADLERKEFYAKKGDILIWHANLLHGGSPIKTPGTTRKSMVLHFFCEDVICYHEITQRPTIFEQE